jgi:4'-phosphopantetheinyl transferase
VLNSQANSSCVVFWTEIGVSDTNHEDHAFALHRELLDSTERDRADALAPGPARNRFVVGGALLRTMLAEVTGTSLSRIELDRTCAWCGGPHGKPRVLGALADWHVSVSHGGRLVGVALTKAGPVGLDVEPLDRRDYRALLPISLASDEPEPGSLREFLTYWTRKESVVKATGDGLVMPMPEVVVTDPAASPRLLRYGTHERPAQMTDLRPDSAHVAALTVFSSDAIDVRQHRLPAVPLPEAA